jgi:hypothetical protein
VKIDGSQNRRWGFVRFWQVSNDTVPPGKASASLLKKEAKNFLMLSRAV